MCRNVSTLPQARVPGYPGTSTRGVVFSVIISAGIMSMMFMGPSASWPERLGKGVTQARSGSLTLATSRTRRQAKHREPDSDSEGGPPPASSSTLAS
eukprot:3387854-Rhodomonas_salina.1